MPRSKSASPAISESAWSRFARVALENRCAAIVPASVTRYTAGMATRSSRNQGSPPDQGPLTAAERMHRYRARRRAAGLKQERRWVPVRPESVAVYSDHCIVEARSLALHCVIARKIFRRPALLDVARRNLAAWKRARADAERPRCLDEWEQILRRPWPEIAAFITATSAQAARLRQSSPFAGVLDRHERKRVYEAFRA